MAVHNVIQKTEIYYTLYQLSSSFAAIDAHCEKLRQSGMLNPKHSRLYRAFAQELQGEMHAEVMLTLHSIEDEDWNRFGKIRNKWEKYLRGPEPKRKGR
jgi:hypothetical protein